MGVQVRRRWSLLVVALVAALLGSAAGPVLAQQPTSPGAPDAPTVSKGDSGELIAEWQEPSDDGGSAVTGYQLRHSKDGNAWTDVSGTVTEKLWTTIGGLDNGNEYQVQVRAVNSEGAGSWSMPGRGTPAGAPEVRVEEVLTGLSIPWGLAFAPDGTMILTERGGLIKTRRADGTVKTVIADFSDLLADWETGLMGLVVDPDFADNRSFYTCQGHGSPNTRHASIHIVKWSMNADYTVATRVRDPLVRGVGIRIGGQWQHAGCRLRFGPQGHLWITTGDGYSNHIDPQSLTNLNGKVLRVNKDTGAGVPGNPFYASDNADTRRVYTYGHRNPQGLARRPGTEQMWSVEHGTDRNDEINLLTAGGNYGYAPLSHTGEQCVHIDSGSVVPPGHYCIDAPMTDLTRFSDAVEAKWSSGKPTLATSGGIFLEGEHWGAWEGRLAVATLRTESVRLFNFTPAGSLVSQLSVPALDSVFGRLRTPMMGTDGALYATTSNNRPGNFQGNSDGVDKILRLYVYDARADATLSALELTGSDGSSVALSPGFTTGVLRYRAEVPATVTSVTVEPKKSIPRAGVTVNGNDPSTAVALDPGRNTISVKVVAEDGATARTYTVDVDRPDPNSPVVGFSTATYSGTEGTPITIGLSLSAAHTRPVQLQVYPQHASVARWDSDYSLGECPWDDGQPCPFGRGYLDVVIPAGETAYSYEVTTADDDLLEGAETFTLRIHLLSRGVRLGDDSEAVITINDNDEAGVVVSTESVSVTENGPSGTYTVKLAAQPTGPVRVIAFSPNTWKVRVTPRVIDFGGASWDDPQTFSVYGEPDHDAADEEVVVTHTVEARAGSGYAGVEADSVTVSVDDRHSPGVIVETTTLRPGVGATARYRVYLNTDPSRTFEEQTNNSYEPTGSRTVTITATSSDTDVASVSPDSITFTADAYDPQSFTVTGVSAGRASITHTVTGTDTDYTGGSLVIQTVAVRVPEPTVQQQDQEPQQLPAHATPEQSEAAPAAPGPVEELELLATADRLTATWRAPDTGDAPTGYIVRLNPHGTSKGKVKTPTATKTSVTFRNLEAGKTYKVWVRAKNQAGKGPRSYAIVTLPSAPPDPDQPQEVPTGSGHSP